MKLPHFLSYFQVPCLSFSVLILQQRSSPHLARPVEIELCTGHRYSPGTLYPWCVLDLRSWQGHSQGVLLDCTHVLLLRLQIEKHNHPFLQVNVLPWSSLRTSAPHSIISGVGYCLLPLRPPTALAYRVVPYPPYLATKTRISGISVNRSVVRSRLAYDAHGAASLFAKLHGPMFV